MKKLILTLIKFYKKFLSPKNFNIHTCRFTPSCSTYMEQSIEKHGVLKGFVKGFLRILRCNPFFKGGYDPVK